MNRICFNGEFIPASQAVFLPDNKSYRYGEGLFETMRLHRGKIALAPLHMERLFMGMKTLGFPIPVHLEPEQLLKDTLRLAELNNCQNSARIRLSVSGGNGGHTDGDNKLSYLIECWPLAAPAYNENGLVIDFFDAGRKAADDFSHLKSANSLVYAMAMRWAKEKKLNEAIILNAHDRVAEAAISNIFIVLDNQLVTPPVSEGCVAGTVRRHLLLRYDVKEQPLTREEVLAAEEIFLTNAIHGLRWVRSVGNSNYRNNISRKIYEAQFKTIWE